MISQADLIRTLINKNCTDESVMSTVLSPDCTPPKLLEKLTEAERFDLALDVSMKLGLDVIPLWRTWAMRCLQNRNFQGAREKFRHCFLRLRLPGGRSNPAQAKLLDDITRELSKLPEVQLPLAEEIELIKQGKLSTLSDCLSSEQQKSVIEKPKIYSECHYYLAEYGTIEARIKFSIRNSLWEEAIKILLDEKLSEKINLDKFFISEVVQYSTTRGSFSLMIDAFLKLDPNVTIVSQRYFKAIYGFCLRNRRYNLLYYVQNSIGDYVAAARTQIDFFFLKKPLQTYRELNQRLPNLISALGNYSDYLELIDSNSNNPNNYEGDKQTRLIAQEKPSSLFSSMSRDEVERQICLLNLQIDITKNFSINEVSGCISGINLVGVSRSSSFKQRNIVGAADEQSTTTTTSDQDDSIPVTLFDKKSERRETFLAALILIYYDLACSSYFSRSGLDLANKIIKDHGLDKIKVFKTAMRIMIEDESCDILENASLLMARIKEDYLANNNNINNNKKKPTTNVLMSKSVVSDPKKADNKSTGGGGGGNKLLTLATNNKAALPLMTTTTARRQSNSSHKSDKSDKSNRSSKSTTTASPLVIGSNDQESGQQNFNKSAGLLSAAAEHRQQVTTNNHQLRRQHDDGARATCDEVIRDAIGSCREADYKMELAKLLSGEAKIELYIEHGKLSNAQTLACTMNRPDYVSSIIEEASKLNQNHVKTVCQLWLAKHETKNFVPS